MNETTASDSSTETALLLAHLNRGGTIGVTLIGVILSAMLYGITCIQTFQYYRSQNYKGDTWIIKALVVILLVFDSAHQVFTIHIVYYYLVTNYGNPAALQNSVWTIPAEIIMNAIMAFVVDGFFVMRVWKLSQNRIVAGTCAFATVAHLVTNLVFPIRLFAFTSLIEGEVKLKIAGTVGAVVGAVTDVCISAAMVWCLTKEKIRSRRTANMITRLVTLTITSGLMTTVVEISILIAYIAAPSLLYNLFFNFMLSKLYANAYLTSLNSREYVRGNNGNAVGVNSIALSTIQRPRMESSDVRSGSSPGRTIVTKVDEDGSINKDIEKADCVV